MPVGGGHGNTAGGGLGVGKKRMIEKGGGRFPCQRLHSLPTQSHMPTGQPHLQIHTKYYTPNAHALVGRPTATTTTASGKYSCACMDMLSERNVHRSEDAEWVFVETRRYLYPSKPGCIGVQIEVEPFPFDVGSDIEVIPVEVRLSKR